MMGALPREQLERISERVAELITSQQAGGRRCNPNSPLTAFVILNVGDLTRENESGCRTISSCTYSRF